MNRYAVCVRQIGVNADGEPAELFWITLKHGRTHAEVIATMDADVEVVATCNLSLYGDESDPGDEQRCRCYPANEVCPSAVRCYIDRDGGDWELTH